MIQNNEIAQISSLTRENILGDMFYAGSLGYYGQLITTNKINGIQENAFFHLAAGLGTFGYEPNVDTFFGIPRSIQAGGIQVDIPFVQASQVSSGDIESLRVFNLQIGLLSSSLEHIIPEQMFNFDPNAPQEEGISAFKALQKALTQGQRIYVISSENINQALQNINHDVETINDISQSVLAGKTVITHTDAVSVPGWSGAGYVVLDPDTNVGAWMISGGSNGGYIRSTINMELSLIDSFITFIEEICAVLCNKILQGLVAIKDFLSNLLLIVEILEKCNRPTAIAALFSIGFLIQGFGTFARLLSRFPTNPAAIVGAIALGITTVILVSKISEDFLEACESET